MCKAFLLMAAPAMLIACAPAAAPVHGAAADDGRGQTNRIVMREHSNVCVSVQVDQRVWPIPKTEETDRALSGILASELRRLYEQQGRSSFVPNPGPGPGPRPEPRFASDARFDNPICRDVGQDIYIIASYIPRPDGTPFVFNYRIEQGGTVQSGTFSRDIQEEWRTGQLPVWAKTQPLQTAVADDLRDRAPILLEEID